MAPESVDPPSKPSSGAGVPVSPARPSRRPDGHGVTWRPSNNKSWSATRSLPSATQLGLRPTRILLRGALGCCPACGGIRNFHRWFRMQERCSTCTLQFERVEGHWIGFLGTNSVIVSSLMFVLMFGATLLAYPETPGAWLLWAMLGTALLVPVLLYKTSRMLWTAIDLLMRPLEPGEIDPRFIAVDPNRDHPKGP